MVNQLPTRRQLLTGIAAGGVALPLLAACGAATAPVISSGTPLAKASDVPVGGGVILGKVQLVVTQPTKGQFKCFTAVCTHQQCVVGKVSDGVIQCPCHGSQFSIADGAVQAGPAPSPLKEFPIRVSKGEVIRG